MKTDNITLYGITNDTERYSLFTWSLLVLLSSLSGDSIILLGTIKYGAIKQHNIIVAVIQHMAVCDLILAVFRVFPSSVSLITDQWEFGEGLCHNQNHVIFVCNGVTMLLTCAMSTFKLLILKYPLRAGNWTARTGHKICCALWVSFLMFYTPTLIVILVYVRDTIHFSYRGYDCDYDLSSRRVPTWFRSYGLVGFIAGTTLPLAVLITTSVMLLVVARRAAGRLGGVLKWEGVVTVLITVVVFFVSYLPSGALIVAGVIAGVRYSSTTRRAVLYLNYINIMSNFIVYALTVRSFRQFLKLKLSGMISLLLRARREYNSRRGERRDKGETQTVSETTQRREKRERQVCVPLLVQGSEVTREEDTRVDTVTHDTRVDTVTHDTRADTVTHDTRV